MKPCRPYLLFSLLLILIALNSCDKTPSAGFNYTFENLSDKPVNVDIYPTLADYNNGTNLLMTGRADVRGYAVFPLDKFIPGQKYYVDWYSDDYLYTNWFWTNVTLVDTFTPSKDNFQFIINKMQFADPSRNIWLNSSGPQTIWKAVDAYSYSGGIYKSIWSSMPAAMRNATMYLHKNFTAQITVSTTDTLITYQANLNTATNQSIASLINADKSSFGTLTSNFSPASKGFTLAPDTLLAHFNSFGYYVMVRQ